MNPDRQPIPLAERKLDWLFLGFFIFNLVFITYFVDVEQVLIPDTSNFTYPIWPPKAAVDLFHWYGRTYDPLLVARPPFWRATIWLDVLLFGPFYVAAIYAFWKGRDWIRLPTIIYSTMLFTNVVIILFEERLGVHAAPSFAGDTIYAWSEVLSRDALPGRSDIGVLRLRTVATKDRACADFPGHDPGVSDPAVVLDLDYSVLVPRKG